ncbi:MAG: hypothetical protein OXI66_11800 [Boseongicola sp.]|nr:hypothetical protein [Boseongicola sp.]
MGSGIEIARSKDLSNSCMAAVTTAPRVVRVEFQDRMAAVPPAKGVVAALGVGVHLRLVQS